MNRKLSLIHVATVAALAWVAAPAHANTPAEGVKCPSGTVAKISDGERKLVCEGEERIERASVCSPIVFKGNGSIDLNTRIEMVSAGSDTCQARNTAGAVIATVPSQALFLPGDDPTQFSREVRSSGADVFVRTRKAYRFPEGGPNYSGDPSKGVRCETGYDGDARFSGRGIRCDRYEVKKAVCDFGWQIDRNNGLDRCFIDKIVFGNRVRVDGQYTIPEGTTGLTGNPETNGWNLVQDYNGTQIDHWRKEAKDYRFPKAVE
jgi:hypothetical protein